jgi:hypothetical protein
LLSLKLAHYLVNGISEVYLDFFSDQGGYWFKVNDCIFQLMSDVTNVDLKINEYIILNNAVVAAVVTESAASTAAIIGLLLADQSLALLISGLSLTTTALLASKVSKNSMLQEFTPFNTDALLNIQIKLEAPISTINKGPLETDPYITLLYNTDHFKIENDKLTLNISFPQSNHDHNELYANIIHDHNKLYANINHDHNELYANINHDHNELYANINHDHDAQYAKIIIIIT